MIYYHPQMEGLHVAERVHALRLAPGEELAYGAATGFAGMAIADIRGKEIHELRATL